MDVSDAVPILKSIIERERKDGCPMASESLIEPSLRRWKSYERRNKRNNNKTFEHRVLDLKKGLITLFPDYGYDESCLTHLAESFVTVLGQEEVVSHESEKAAQPPTLPSSAQGHDT